MTGSETLRRQWIAMLAIAIRPLAAPQTAEALVMLLPLLAHHDDNAFNHDNLLAIASADEPVSFRLINRVMTAWAVKQRQQDRNDIALPRPDPIHMRIKALREEWDDADGILRLRQSIVAAHSPFQPIILRLLHSVVRRYAPQHAHIVAPAIRRKAKQRSC